MAKPRVFVSSTYYDLKHLRSSLERFIESLGFEPILSEKGDIAYTPDAALDESCYREATSADIFVLIIGGRYGSEASIEEKKPNRSFFERYDSITKLEYRHAVGRNVPTYILIEANVHSEYRTFLNNKDNTNVRYAHVDSVNIFALIEEILTQPKNNPVLSFERYSQMEQWLREQWAGLFKELLGRIAGQQQISSLSQKVAELGEINETLRRYLEAIISKLSPKEADRIIESEGKRLEEAQQLAKLRENRWVSHVTSAHNVPFEACINALKVAKSFTGFVDHLVRHTGLADEPAMTSMRALLAQHELAREDLNKARMILGLDPFPRESELSPNAELR